MKRFIFSCVLAFTLWATLPAQASIADWDTIISDAAKTLSQPVEEVTPTELDTARRSLKNVRTEAGDFSRESGSEKERLQTLLETLGKKPDEESEIEEDPAVAEKRKELRDAISAQDANVKQASLAMTRANELLDNLLQFEQSRQRDRLFSRQAEWYASGYTGELLADAAVTIDYITASPLWILIGHSIQFALILFLLAATAFLLVSVAERRLVSTGAALSGVSRTPLIMYSVCASVLMLLHYESAAVLAPEVRIFATAGAAVLSAISAITALLGLQLSEETGLRRFLKRLIKLSRMVLWISIPAAAAGYVYLATYINLMIFSCYVALCAFITLRTVLDHYARSSGDSVGSAPAKGLSPLGIALVEPILAFLCLQIPLYFAGFHPEDVLDWFSRYKEGFDIGSIHFYPTDIVIGLGMFFGLIFLFKGFQWFLSGRVFPNTKLDSGVKNAAISLVGYAGVVFAMISLLSALGINTSNLAIVAGALSVGIGFGLQAVISNFVSGLIMLFERPVRVGDWVIVGETEGFVKKINVRSTRIETFQRADILVPNSRFITEPVCNWTLHSASGRVDIPVGVAYGSDTEKVRDILLDVTKKHPCVLNYPGVSVLFIAFGASSLDFMLRCHIKDITDRLVVASDLHFAIDKAFREADIEIPFPQRDLHVRSVVAEALPHREATPLKRDDGEKPNLG